MTDLPADLLDQLATVGNKALNDHYHDDLCACSEWPAKCVSSGRYFAGYWDTSAFDIALPAIIAAYEQHLREQIAQEILTSQDGSPWRGDQNPRQGGIDNWIDSRDVVKAARIARGSLPEEPHR